MGRTNTAGSLKEYFSSGINKKKFEEAKERAKQGSSYDYNDGKYDAQLISIEVGKSKASGRLQVVIAFKFTSGDYKGKTIRKFSGIDDTEGRGVEYLLRDLKTLGFPDVDMEEIEDAVFTKLNKKKPSVKIQLKTKDGSEYQNLYILGLADGAVEEESEDEDNDDDDTEADEPEETPEKAEASDEDDDEDGEEDSEDEDSEDDEDEEDEAEEKPAPKSKKPEPEDEDDEEDDEKVEIAVGTKLKVQYKKEVKKAKVVRLDEENGKVKVKFEDGEKVWVKAEDIIDTL